MLHQTPHTPLPALDALLAEISLLKEAAVLVKKIDAETRPKAHPDFESKVGVDIMGSLRAISWRLNMTPSYQEIIVDLPLFKNALCILEAIWGSLGPYAANADPAPKGMISFTTWNKVGQLFHFDDGE